MIGYLIAGSLVVFAAVFLGMTGDTDDAIFFMLVAIWIAIVTEGKQKDDHN